MVKGTLFSGQTNFLVHASDLITLITHIYYGKPGVSVGGMCDFQSQGCRVEPHIGYGGHLNNKILKNTFMLLNSLLMNKNQVIAN